MKNLVEWLEQQMKNADSSSYFAYLEVKEFVQSNQVGLTCHKCSDLAPLTSHKCQHYWVKMMPLNPANQKYLCLNCDEVK